MYFGLVVVFCIITWISDSDSVFFLYIGIYFKYLLTFVRRRRPSRRPSAPSCRPSSVVVVRRPSYKTIIKPHKKNPLAAPEHHHNIPIISPEYHKLITRTQRTHQHHITKNHCQNVTKPWPANHQKKIKWLYCWEAGSMALATSTLVTSTLPSLGIWWKNPKPQTWRILWLSSLEAVSMTLATTTLVTSTLRSSGI